MRTGSVGDRPARAANGSDDVSVPTVLVVDDEPDLADLYAAWLDPGYEVRTSYGGASVTEQIDGDVDVVLLDRLMPDRPGDEVLATIREQDHDCRVAMVTAVEPDFDIIEMGFDDYLVKPVLRDELLDAVERLLTRTAYDAQLQEFYALASKRAALLTQKDERELDESKAYATLTERIEQLRVDMDETVGDLGARDFEFTLRELGDGSHDEDGNRGESRDRNDGKNGDENKEENRDDNGT